ncbi:hypothetical protein MTsDn5_13850 [Alteromonas gracilis]|uniref:motility associated factor glycosyltransferase family protein n=1 Tax=Alteromonas gracilis TaxID=1479524 RepID=UPI0036F2E018
MRKAIQLFLDKDEEHQAYIEHEKAPVLSRNVDLSLLAFRRNMPSIYSLLNRNRQQKTSIYLNADGEFDVVDYGSGNVLYGAKINDSIKRSVENFLAAPTSFSFTPELALTQNDMSSPNDTLVIMGLGLGAHLPMLMASHLSLKHIIIYEPNIDYLVCSLYTGVWLTVFELAKRNNIAIYLQIEKNGESLFKDFSEFYEHVSRDKAFIYFHYHSDAFDGIYNALKNTDWVLSKTSTLYNQKRSFLDYIVPWPPIVNPREWNESNLNTALFASNISALEHYFPSIAAEFAGYETSHWDAVANESGLVNLAHKKTGSFLYTSNPQDDSDSVIEMFKTNPNRDGLVLSYTGGKLKRYFHYQTVLRVQQEMKNMAEVQGALPAVIKSLIMFGLGQGLQLKKLLDEYDVEKLFLVEPNRDFFYASLFSIDWATILQKIDEKEGRLYLNIGDDGTHLGKDILRQFQTIGTYNLTNTYLLKGYDNSLLEPAINKLREELRLIVAMGDYFEHSRYGVAHTKWALENKVRLLSELDDKNRHKLLDSVPVLVVGNGPSLDNLIPLLHEEKERAIIVSCGTALQALHKNGIVPDFHAEVEQNRSTFDWSTRIEDPEYLKKIRLISCNGIHPDTIKLYKDAYLALKTGEAASLMISALFPEQAFAGLKTSYPTVSNFVVNLICEIGFKEVYLFGVDMGFVDINHHHSKSSGYYQANGKELYSYQQEYNASLIVEGNLRPYVNTKYEFKMSKTIMEQTIAAYDTEFYNLNDGAKIEGARALHKENIIISSTVEQKRELIDWIEREAYALVDKDLFISRYTEKHKLQSLLEGLQNLRAIAQQKIDSIEAAEKCIDEIRMVLIDAYHSGCATLFYYMNGSVNYINSVLNKILNFEDQDMVFDVFERTLGYWEVFLDDAIDSMTLAPYELDFVTSFPLERQRAALNYYFSQNKITVDSVTSKEALTSMGKTLSLPLGKRAEASSTVFIERFKNVKTAKASEKQCLIVSEYEDLHQFLEKPSQLENKVVVFVPSLFETLSWGDEYRSSEEYSFYIAVLASTCRDEIKFVLPKIPSELPSSEVISKFDLGCFDDFYIYDCHNFIAFSESPLSESALVTGSGERLRYLPTLRDENFATIEILVSKSKVK